MSSIQVKSRFSVSPNTVIGLPARIASVNSQYAMSGRPHAP